MEAYVITPTLRLLNLQPQIPGQRDFIGSYLFCSEKKAIVDVGPRAAIPHLTSALQGLHISPSAIDYIVLTHLHIDHAGGAGTAVKEMTGAQVIAHSRAVYHLTDPTALWEASVKTLGDLAFLWGDVEPVPGNRVVAAEDLMKVDLGGGLVLEIHHTPGHAPHHMSLFDSANGVLIAGETAGVCIAGVARPSTPPPFKLKEALSSIDRLIALNPVRLCYGHFGCYEDAVERLRLIRQKLLMWHGIVRSAADTGKNPHAILLILREKDKSLDYLDSLDKDEYQREYRLLLNSITGLSHSVV